MSVGITDSVDTSGLIKMLEQYQDSGSELTEIQKSDSRNEILAKDTSSVAVTTEAVLSKTGLGRHVNIWA